MCLKFWDLFPSKKCLSRISFKRKSYCGVEPVYSLLNLIHFHMNTLTFPWETEGISIIIWLARFIASQPIRNSRKPGCGLFKIPRNCGRRDFKLTCIPTLLATLPPKQYNTPTLILPATQAIHGGALKKSANSPPTQIPFSSNLVI